MATKFRMIGVTRWGCRLELTPIDPHVKLVVSTNHGQRATIQRENAIVVKPEVTLAIQPDDTSKLNPPNDLPFGLCHCN
jgi:hypothetical protein